MSWEFAYDSPKAIGALLTQREFAMTKKFGQNFLISTPMRRQIVDLLEVEAGDQVIEVGPGIGSLTTLLLEAGVHLTAFEIDRGFCAILREEAFGDEERFTLVEGDALKTLFRHLDTKPVADRIVGNLPYNVGTILIARIMESMHRPALMVFTVQKEVAQRLSAIQATPMWSSLSLLAQMDYDVTIAASIAPGAFYPPPKVESSVVTFRLRGESRVPAHLRQTFLMVTKDLFAQRRKTILNTFRGGKSGALVGRDGVHRIFSSVDIDPQRRAETLSWDEFIALSAALYRYRATADAGTQ